MYMKIILITNHGKKEFRLIDALTAASAIAATNGTRGAWDFVWGEKAAERLENDGRYPRKTFFISAGPYICAR